jgi:lipopolysaccharide transport system permease protein
VPSHRTRARAGLLWTLVRTEFKSRYHGTLGGFLWALAKPCVMFLVLWAVFSFVFSSDAEYRTNLIIGLFLYDFFAESTKAGVLALYSKGYLISRAKFPAWILVVASLANAALTLVVFFAALFTVRWFVADLDPGSVALVASYLVIFAAMVLGLSLGTSVLFLRYRDLNQIWDMALQAGFFLAPVIYPIAIIPERYHGVLYAWPPTAIIEFTRSVIVDARAPAAAAHLGLVAAAGILMIVGIAVFRRLAPRAAEHL